MTDSGKKLWYVVQTNPREEARALHYLNEKDVETFFPRIKVVRYRGGKVGQVVRPMFPSYIFVRFSVPEEIPYVHWTRGVKRILGAEENPVPISDEVVSFITDQTDDEGVAKIGSPLKPKDKGEGLHGSVQGPDRHFRASHRRQRPGGNPSPGDRLPCKNPIARIAARARPLKK